MTFQVLFDKGLFDNYDNADEFLKDFLFDERRSPDLEDLNDGSNVIQWFCSEKQF